MTAQATLAAARGRRGCRGRPRGAPSTRQRLWTAMRVLKRFDTPLLTLAAEASERAAAGYVRALCRAGLVRPVNGAGHGDDGASYALVGRPGPIAPSPVITMPPRVAGTSPTFAKVAD